MQHAYKMTELAPADRSTVERLLGRPLDSDETIEIVTRRVPPAPPSVALAGRQRAAARILELAQGKTLGGLTARELIEEGRR